MLDLNVDASSSGDEVDYGKTESAADSVASTTTTTSANNNAATDEADCSSWTSEKYASTLNFAILNNDVIEIEDDPDNDVGNELQLFPIANSPSPAMVRAKYWLNLSVPEVDEIHFRVLVNSLSSMRRSRPQSPIVSQQNQMEREKESEIESNASAVQVKGVPIHGGKFIQYNVLGNLFEVPSKYAQPITPVGRGAYGLVCSATNAETMEEVAIKRIANAFDNRIDAKRTLRVGGFSSFQCWKWIEALRPNLTQGLIG
ncbi:hypothetical protein SASPL_102024 [Salvia splendens]|uniref:Uncharacterized protein n=1 Tax=Salvia splendens TaxID=180675 RepID=A0A8X9AE38_SALSN|nr:hypothetical protein SASPL_102024 [Salvia splendens]